MYPQNPYNFFLLQVPTYMVEEDSCEMWDFFSRSAKTWNKFYHSVFVYFQCKYTFSIIYNQ